MESKVFKECHLKHQNRNPSWTNNHQLWSLKQLSSTTNPQCEHQSGSSSISPSTCLQQIQSKLYQKAHPLVINIPTINPQCELHQKAYPLIYQTCQQQIHNVFHPEVHRLVHQHPNNKSTVWTPSESLSTNLSNMPTRNPQCDCHQEAHPLIHQHPNNKSTMWTPSGRSSTNLSNMPTSLQAYQK